MRKLPTAPGIEDVAKSVLAVEHLRAVAETLRPHAIPVMPLKGVLLQAAVYDAPLERPLSDVDILVPPALFSRAMDVLCASGWVALREVASDAARDLVSPHNPLPVDLHRRPFQTGFFRLDPDAMFRRSRPDDALFGVRVCLPDPYDLYAHLVGHFATGRLGPDDRAHVRDLTAVARSYALDSGLAAARLEATGLARAARYAVGLAEDGGDAFAAEVLAALPRDPLGRIFAFAARQTFQRVNASSRLAIVPSHLLNTSLAAAGTSLLRRGIAAGRVYVRYGDRRQPRDLVRTSRR